MNSPVSQKPEKKPSLLENWISLIGIIVSAASFFAVVCLFTMDLIRESSNPYVGILTYIIVPSFLVVGLLLIVVGVAWEWRRRHHLAPGEVPRHPRIDFNIPKHRRVFLITSIVTFVFLLITALGSYRTFHFTESVQFCGKTCHSVMKPEYTAYQNSSHARVDCVQCHIGPGAGWFVKSKLSGSYQVYSVLAHKYPRPIPTPIENLRPAQETCEQCHWPKKFFGNVERVNYHFLADETNTPWTVRLLMKVGGGDPSFGPVGGIHWHMNINNKTEYIATDHGRQKIPWVRVTGPDGKVTVYQSTEEPLKPEQVATEKPRRMDCIDCHNRPAHVYQPPSRLVNIAMSTGRISIKLPSIKKNAVEVLAKEYQSTEEAKQKIAKTLQEKYKDYPNQVLVQQAITEVEKVYGNNFFPEMKVSWLKYPNNIGHTIFPGCFRCHDGKHKSDDGRVITHSCDACHTIIGQGQGEKSGMIQPSGMEFEHPVDIGDSWKEMNCYDCHTGALTQ